MVLSVGFPLWAKGGGSLEATEGNGISGRVFGFRQLHATWAICCRLLGSFCQSSAGLDIFWKTVFWPPKRSCWRSCILETAQGNYSKIAAVTNPGQVLLHFALHTPVLHSSLRCLSFLSVPVSEGTSHLQKPFFLHRSLLTPLSPLLLLFWVVVVVSQSYEYMNNLWVVQLKFANLR